MAFKVSLPGETPIIVDAPTPEDAHAAAMQMPKFNVALPGENPVIVRGADHEDAHSRLLDANKDFSVGSGLKEAGAAGLRGIGYLTGAAGSLRDTGQNIAKWGIKKLTGHEVEPGGVLDRIMKYSSPFAMLPNMSDTKSAIDTMSGDYSKRQPHNVKEEYIRTGAEFLPAAVTAAATSGAGLIPMMLEATAPAIASETAGQVARNYLPEIKENEYVKKYGPEWMPSTEDLARMAAAFGGSAAATKLISPNSGRMTAEQFVDAAKKKVNIGTDQPIGQSPVPPRNLEDAHLQSGAEYRRLSSHDIAFDSTLRREAVTHFNDYFDTVGANRAPALIKTLRNMQSDAAAGVITGNRFQNYIERLRKLSKSGVTGADKDTAAGLRKSLNDAMERHLAVNAPDDLGAFKDVRNKYRDTQTLIDAEAAANGRLFTPDQLATAVKSHAGNRNFVFNKNDLGNLSKTVRIVPTTDFKMADSALGGVNLPLAAGATTSHFFGPDVGIAVGAGTRAAQTISRAGIERMMNAPVAKAYRFNQLMPVRQNGLIKSMMEGAAAQQSNKNRGGGAH